MADCGYGRILSGVDDEIQRSWEALQALSIDQEVPKGVDTGFECERETTLGSRFSVTGPGTFFAKAVRTLNFEPTRERGWWFDRTDLPDVLPIAVSIRNVWTTVRNIVLCSGSPHNYMRMVEHIIALKVGMGLDNVMIRMDSGDPPLFDRGSMDLVESAERAGVVPQDRPATYVTVKEPVTMAGPHGSFLTFTPAEGRDRRLEIDCGIAFKSAIGRQRIRFTVTRDTFRYGALARTNTTLGMMLYCRTIGKIFADVRHLGYTTRNILIAGPKRYANDPKLVFNGRSLEAAWHRAVLDLLAAVALIDKGRFAGRITSYKAGHALDVNMIRKLYQQDLFEVVP
jgi:UDP-3-O-acyl-N-acetylglucosamine deacetylase